MFPSIVVVVGPAYLYTPLDLVEPIACVFVDAVLGYVAEVPAVARAGIVSVIYPVVVDDDDGVVATFSKGLRDVDTGRTGLIGPKAADVV